MSLSLATIRQAQSRLAPHVVRTPLLRLHNLDRYLGCQVYAKAECMQLTGSFKLRGAMNKMLSLSWEELRRGVVAASSGNHGRALAYAAQALGVQATIVLPDTTPPIKRDNIVALGARTVICPAAERFAVAEDLRAQTGGALIPPYNDEAVMAGQGTAGLELIEQGPDLNAVVVPVSGGGLISGVATAVKALAPSVKVIGAEPAALPRYSVSLAAGKPTSVPGGTTIADALISQAPGDKCFPVVQAQVDAMAAVDDPYILQATKLLLLEGKLWAEPSSCIGLGGVLQGKIPVQPQDKVCFLISGGNVGLGQIKILEETAE